MNYEWKIPSNGRTPVGRTPAYPYIIKICHLVLGEERYLLGVVVLQIIVGLISVVFLYKTLFLSTQNQKLAFLVTVIYGSSPTVIQWDTMILTESFSISGAVLFLYLIVSYIHKPSLPYGLGTIILSFILTMLRPSFLLVNYALLCFWIFRLYYREERFILKRLVSLSLIVIVLIQLYSYLVFLEYGDFSLTPLTPRHLLAACLRSGVYQYTPNTELAQTIQGIYEQNNRSISYDTTTPVMELFGDNIRVINLAVKEFCLDCIQRNPKQYIASIFATMRDQANINIYGRYTTMAYEHPLFTIPISIQTSLCTVLKFGHMYFLCFAEAITTVWIYIRQKKLDWIHLGLAANISMIVLYTFVGTYAEFGRCIIHILPFVILSLALLFNHIIRVLSQEIAQSDNS